MGLIIGELRERITIQSFSTTSQPGGGKTKAWTDVITVWAKVIPANGGEAFAQGVARNTQFYRVEIRFRTGITPANRLMWRGTALNIRTCADPDSRRESLMMTVESGAGEP
jgi:SPP1 family predicted phage head-tail adaptor